MKTKGFIRLIPVILLLSMVLPLTGTAQGETHNWYCVHVPDHVQPRAGGDISFVEEVGGYYIDRRHSGKDDRDKVIYLTFDAGYENGNVAKVLDILKEEQVTGAFFVLSNLIRHDPALVKRMAEEGHTVCNHTAHHRDMTGMNDAEFLAELQSLETVYTETVGQEMAKYYRPPEGKFNRANLVCAKENGYKTIFWSFAYPDWDNNRQMSPEKATKIILDNVHNGEVMLLHPTSATNAAVLSGVLRELKNQGYRFGTLDELTGDA